MVWQKQITEQFSLQHCREGYQRVPQSQRSTAASLMECANRGMAMWLTEYCLALVVLLWN